MSVKPFKKRFDQKTSKPFISEASEKGLTKKPANLL
jgi:hypothetical protein